MNIMKHQHVNYDVKYPKAKKDDVVTPPSTVPVEKALDRDILFGRGGLTNHHPGTYSTHI